MAWGPGLSKKWDQRESKLSVSIHLCLFPDCGYSVTSGFTPVLHTFSAVMERIPSNHEPKRISLFKVAFARYD